MANIKMRAARHGVSMEEEARQIIYQTVSAPEKIMASRKSIGRPLSLMDGQILQ